MGRTAPNARTIFQICDQTASVLAKLAGRSKEIKTRFFDLFFTTKAVGKGTGLGLAISYQIIVNRDSGVFKCTSKLNQVTEFIIEIPLK